MASLLARPFLLRPLFLVDFWPAGGGFVLW
jgi:hypothetical protein